MNTRTVSLGLAVILMSMLPGALLAQSADTQPSSKPAAALPFTISKETTQITSPLQADGRVDYLSAINAKYSAGVTKDNNAAIPLIEALGPDTMTPEMRPAVYKALGIEKDPAGPFLDASLDNAVNGPLMNTPWRGKDHADVAKWLKDNDQALGRVVAAAKRPRYFLPLVASDEKNYILVNTYIPILSKHRQAARMLAMRANLAIGEGRVQDAWGDIQAICRLGSLFEQDCTLIGRLIGIAINTLGDQAIWNLATSGKLDSKSARTILDDFAKLPPTPTVISVIDQGERYYVLDAIAYLATSRPEEGARVQNFLGTIHGNDPKLPPVRLAGADWDDVLRQANKLYDGFIVAVSTKDLAERYRLVKAFEDDLRTRNERMKNVPPANADRTAKTQWAADFILGVLVPTLGGAQTLADTAATKRQLSSVALALAAYRADKGKYPQKLDELTPAYIKEVPIDFFMGGREFVYTQQAQGYVLYSVGMNGNDDGGKDIPQGKDDIVVRAQE